MRVGGVRRMGAIPRRVIGPGDHLVSEICEKGADTKKRQNNRGGDEAFKPSVLGRVDSHVEAFSKRRVLNLRRHVQLSEDARFPRMHL